MGAGQEYRLWRGPGPTGPGCYMRGLEELLCAEGRSGAAVACGAAHALPEVCALQSRPSRWRAEEECWAGHTPGRQRPGVLAGRGRLAVARCSGQQGGGLAGGRAHAARPEASPGPWLGGGVNVLSGNLWEFWIHWLVKTCD